MWVKNKDKVINAGFSVAKAGMLVLVMPMIFTVGCVSYVAINMWRIAGIIHKSMRRCNET